MSQTHELGLTKGHLMNYLQFISAARAETQLDMDLG